MFECPALSERTLRFQVYMDRSDQNYEGRVDSRAAKQVKPGLPPWRYEIIQSYDEVKMATMLQRCHRVFLDCIDYDSASMGNIAMAFDMLS